MPGIVDRIGVGGVGLLDECRAAAFIVDVVRGPVDVADEDIVIGGRLVGDRERLPSVRCSCGLRGGDFSRTEDGCDCRCCGNSSAADELAYSNDARRWNGDVRYVGRILGERGSGEGNRKSRVEEKVLNSLKRSESEGGEWVEPND